MFRIISIFIVVIYILPFLLLLNPIYIFEFYQVMTILLAFLLGGFIVKKKINSRPIDYQNFYITNEKILSITFLVYFISNFQMFIDVFMHLFVYHDYAAWALENTIKRYAGELENGALKKISTITFTMYMVFLGTYGFQKKWKKYYFLLFLMLIVESSALARAGVLMGFVVYFSEFLIRHNSFFSSIKTIKLIKIGLIVFIVISGIFFFSAYFRIQNENNISEILMDKLGSYLLSTYEALYIWMKNTEAYANTFGFSTFTGIYKILTNVEVPAGFYGSVQTQYGSTVIYTTIRGFLADFGYILTVMIFFISGVFIKYFTYVRMGFFSYFLIRLILFLILYMLYSPFLFATIFIGYILSYIILIGTNINLYYKFNKKILRKK